MHKIQIAEFGSAPKWSAQGFVSFGAEFHATEEQALNMFILCDDTQIVLVKGGLYGMSDDEYVFYPMIRKPDPVQEAKSIISGLMNLVPERHEEHLLKAFNWLKKYGQ